MFHLARFTRRPGTTPATAQARKTPARLTPNLDRLEMRDLMSIVAGRSTVLVHPGVLPNSGKYMPIHVYGEIATTRKGKPSGFFIVTDEYRRDEPHGKVALTPAPPGYGFNMWAFDFTIRVHAQRSKGTPDGRHYDLLVGAEDFDNTDGKTVAILVPKTYQPHALGVATPQGAGTHAKGRLARSG